MFRKMSLLVLIVASLSNVAMAGEQIKSAGSSTIFPFITVVAEEFRRNTEYKSPIVEATGTGGGIMLFCLGNGDESKDLANASRAMRKKEKELCAKNGVKDITEIKIGYDGIIFANSADSKKLNLTKEQIFLAISRKIPANGKLVENNYKKWSDIDPSLPNKKIEIYGPPKTSGTRDLLEDLVMNDLCVNNIAFKAAYPDKNSRNKECHMLRNDSAFIEVGENDNFIVEKLRNSPDALGIFGFSFLDQNVSSVQGVVIDGVRPTFENIFSSYYPVSRPLFIYLKDSHLDKTPGLREFVKELVSDNAIGDGGYLVEKGLIPLHEDELAIIQETINNK